MADLFAKGSAWLAKQRHAHASHPVTYRRGGLSVTLSATRGRSESEYVDEQGILITMHTDDFLLRPEDLVFDNKRIEPQSGDKITDDGEVYEVLATTNEPCWRWTDAQRNTMRIHTKRYKVNLGGQSC